MPNNKVIDLSHHNTVPESFELAHEAGIRGVIHKATEGTGYVDSKVDARFYLAKQSHMLWGIYHFLRPGNMQAQAEFFLNSSQDFSDKNTLLAADHEDPGVSLANLIDFLEAVEEMSGRTPVIYSGHVLKEQLGSKPNADLEGYRLWLAQYSSSPTLPPGFESYYLWQYTDSGNVPGIQPPTDCNDYQGTDAELKETWAGRKSTPIPPKPPKPDGGTITIKIPKETIEITFRLPGKND